MCMPFAFLNLAPNFISRTLASITGPYPIHLPAAQETLLGNAAWRQHVYAFRCPQLSAGFHIPDTGIGRRPIPHPLAGISGTCIYSLRATESEEFVTLVRTQKGR